MLAKTLSAGGRFAGKALSSLFKVPGTDNYMKKGDLLFRLMPEGIFAVTEGVMTPGDITDKLIAGASTGIGGSMGGLALGRLGGKNVLLGQALDMAGSIGGEVGGQLQRGKDRLAGGKGQTPYERLSEDDRQKLEQLIREDQTGRILAELGLLPASTQSALIS